MTKHTPNPLVVIPSPLAVIPGSTSSVIPGVISPLIPGLNSSVIPGLTRNLPRRSSHRPATFSSWMILIRPAPRCTPATPPCAPILRPASPSRPSPWWKARLPPARKPYVWRCEATGTCQGTKKAPYAPPAVLEHATGHDNPRKRSPGHAGACGKAQ